MSERVKRALEVYAAHRWNATTQLCACGEFFEATLKGVKLHKAHRMEKALEATDELLPLIESGADGLTFCDQCAGPYEGWLMDVYGGHWDTCPNRAKALPPKDEELEVFSAEDGE